MIAIGQTVTVPHRRGRTEVVVSEIMEWPEHKNTFGLFVGTGPKGREWRGLVHRDGRITSMVQ